MDAPSKKGMDPFAGGFCIPVPQAGPKMVNIVIQCRNPVEDTEMLPQAQYRYPKGLIDQGDQHVAGKESEFMLKGKGGFGSLMARAGEPD